MADNHFIDIRLRKLLRLDLMLLRSAEQIVQERYVELQHFDELNHATISDIELAIEVESARIRVRTVLGDFTVIDVAGELGGVLILFIARLKGADTDAIFFGED